MNIALDGESPYENQDLFRYLQKHMSVMESITNMKYKFISGDVVTDANSGFYTTDGMRFEMSWWDGANYKEHYLYEKPSVKVCLGSLVAGVSHIAKPQINCGGCGSYGLNSNPNKTTKPPCLIMVDVNGDRKPNPANANCRTDSISNLGADKPCKNHYKYALPNGKKLSDLFSIIITDSSAIPYGTAAQKAMYQAQK